MKMIKNIIEYLIAIAVIPAIVLAVVHVTELKDVRNVQYELLSEENGVFNITPGTFDKLRENRRIKNYELESNYPLITQEEMDKGTWKVNDDLKNEIYIDENGVKRIRVNVGRITFDGSESFQFYSENENTIAFVGIIKLGNSNLSNNDTTTATSNILTQQRVHAGYDVEGFMSNGYFIHIRVNKTRLTGYNDSLTNKEKINLFKQWLQELANEGNPLTVWYQLAVKNPNSKIIESSDLYITSDYVRIAKPNDFSGNPDGLLISGLIKHTGYESYVDRYEVTSNWIHVYPSDVTVTELANLMVGKTLYYELPQPRPVEVYDFTKFRLTYDKNRIRVVFDIDDEYYLWEITQDDKMIPINGQYDLGNIWTVKFYVYEIQQPLIRSLVLLIPLIVISGVLIYMYNTIKKKGISY